MIDDGEVDSLSSGGGLLDPYSQFLDDSAIQNEWDMLIGTQICSHKHICNPTTGPDNTHTHICEHTHTHTVGSGDDEKLTKKRRPSGNKEAVRKYREKQKAVKVVLEVRNAELEKENQKIPELQKQNAMLRRKLHEQGPRQDAVEHLLAENKRLRVLLSNLRRAIHSELDGLEDVSYQKLLFNPSKVDRGGGGTYLASGAHCAAPVPCFPARPVAHHDREGSTDDLEHIEGNLGWHTECELGKTVTACRSPQDELEDADVCSDPCTGSGAEVTTPGSNGGTSSSGSKQRPAVCSSKSAAAAARRPRSNNPGQTAATAPTVAVAYQQHHPGGVPCPVASLPLPCFNNGPREAASSVPGRACQPQGERWQEECNLACGDAEITAGSSPIPSATLTPPEDVTQSANALLSEATPPVTPSSKKIRVEGPSSVDLFSPGFYPDCWLEECDIIDGVCQAHLANPCFGPPEEGGHDSGRSPAAAALPPTISNQ